MEEVGQEQEGMPERADAVPGRGHAVLAIAQDDWLHRRPRQERPRLEGQQAYPICGGPLHHSKGLDTVSCFEQGPRIQATSTADTYYQDVNLDVLQILVCLGRVWGCICHLRKQKEWPGCGRKLPSSRQLHPILHLP